MVGLGGGWVVKKSSRRLRRGYRQALACGVWVSGELASQGVSLYKYKMIIRTGLRFDLSAKGVLKSGELGGFVLVLVGIWWRTVDKLEKCRISDTAKTGSGGRWRLLGVRVGLVVPVLLL